MPVPVEQSHTNNNKNGIPKTMLRQNSIAQRSTARKWIQERTRARFYIYSFVWFGSVRSCFTCMTFIVLCVPFSIDELYVQVLSCLHICTLWIACHRHRHRQQQRHNMAWHAMAFTTNSILIYIHELNGGDRNMVGNYASHYSFSFSENRSETYFVRSAHQFNRYGIGFG